MTLDRINRLGDPRLVDYRRLTSDPGSGRFVVEGALLVQRAVASSLRVNSVLASQRMAERAGQLVAENAPLLVADDQLIRDLVGFDFHRGILASVQRPDVVELSQLAAPGPATLVVLPHLADPVNLGGILRTAAALGVDGVLVGSSAADPFSRRVARVSMGAVLHLPIRISENLVDDLQALQQHQFTRWGTVLDPKATELTAIAERPPRLALMLGNEFEGLGEEMLNCCDQQITLPVAAGTDSLNVSVAAGIFLHHLQLNCNRTSEPRSN